jgi:predicted acyltransferase
MLQSTPRRVAAIDVFRAATMLLMLFVNDMAGLSGIPHWLKHAASSEDMMGFSDTIFPAFLFIMGVSIPFAIRARFKKGDRPLDVALHIALRSVALIVMGLYTVNYESLDGASSPIGRSWFAILMVAAFFLVWAVYPKVTLGWKRALFAGMRLAGVGILVFLYLIYTGRNGVPFGTHWWGILGLIGWTYLFSAVVYMVVRDRVVWNFVASGVVVAWCVLNSAGVVGNPIPGAMAHHALGVSGLLVSSLMTRYASPQRPWRFFGWLVALAVVAALGGWLTHGFWIVSKLQATPTWMLWSLAMFLPLFCVIYWLTETRGKARWFRVIAPAGTVTLTCYVIPYVWYSVRSLAGISRPEIFTSGGWGLVGSMIFAFAVVWVAGLMNNCLKIRLKI